MPYDYTSTVLYIFGASSVYYKMVEFFLNINPALCVTCLVGENSLHSLTKATRRVHWQTTMQKNVKKAFSFFFNPALEDFCFVKDKNDVFFYSYMIVHVPVHVHMR